MFAEITTRSWKPWPDALQGSITYGRGLGSWRGLLCGCLLAELADRGREGGGGEGGRREEEGGSQGLGPDEARQAQAGNQLRRHGTVWRCGSEEEESQF